MIKFKLIEDWKTVLHRSWANRLAILSIVLSGAEQALPLLNMVPPEFRHVIPAWLPIALMMLAVYARIVRQNTLAAAQKKPGA